MKRIIATALTTITLVLLMTSVCFAETEYEPLGRLYDEYGVLSEDEYNTVLEALNVVSDRFQVDTSVAVANSMEADGYDDITAYADDLFDYYGYGTGENKDGILLVVAMEERKWAISTHGLAIQYVTDKGNEYLQEQFLPYLSDGDYAKAFLAYAKGCDYLYAERTGQKPSDYFNQSDSYDGDQDFYDDDYDSYEPVSVGRRLEITARYIPIALLVGFLLSMIPMGIMKAKLRTVQQKSGAADYVDRDSLRITDTRDIFLYRTVNRTKRAQENEDHDGPSTTHTSSSGETHGGSSGSF